MAVRITSRIRQQWHIAVAIGSDRSLTTNKYRGHQSDPNVGLYKKIDRANVLGFFSY